MNKGKLLKAAIEKCLKQEKFTVEGDNFNRTWTMPLAYTVDGKKVLIDFCFKAYCTLNGTVYEETVKIYSDKTKSIFKSVPARLYILKEKFDEEFTDELYGMLEGMEKEISFSKGDLTKFIKSQPQFNEAGEIVEKRGRGRPRKEVTEVVAVEKRKRGRPRKEPVDTSALPMVEVSILS